MSLRIRDAITLGNALGDTSVTSICSALAGYIKSRDDYLTLRGVLGHALKSTITDASSGKRSKRSVIRLKEYAQANKQTTEAYLGEKAAQFALAAAVSACRKGDTSSLDPTVLWIVAHMRRGTVVDENDENDVIEKAAYALSQRPGNFANSQAFYNPIEFGSITESAFDGAVSVAALTHQDLDATGRVIDRMVASPAIFDTLSPATQRLMESSCMDRFNAWNTLAADAKTTIGIVKSDAMQRDAHAAAATSGNFMYPTEIWVVAKVSEGETATNELEEDQAKMRNKLREKAALLFYTRAETMPYLPVFGSDYLHKKALYYARRAAHERDVGVYQANLDAAIIEALHTNYTATMATLKDADAQKAAQEAADLAKAEDASRAVYNQVEITNEDLSDFSAAHADLFSFGRAARTRMRLSLYTETD
jgi:hypothetical protein